MIVLIKKKYTDAYKFLSENNIFSLLQIKILCQIQLSYLTFLNDILTEIELLEYLENCKNKLHGSVFFYHKPGESSSPLKKCEYR